MTPIHSWRSVTIGSTRDARQAGSQEATAATAVIAAIAATNDSGEYGSTPGTERKANADLAAALGHH